MKRGGRAGGEGGAERGADEEDCKTTKAAGERGLARAGGRVGGQGETEPEIKEERMGDEKKGNGGCEREERTGDGTGADRQTVRLLFHMCCS